MAKAIFAPPGPPQGRTIVSKNVRRLTSTGLPIPAGLRSIRFQVNPKTGKEDAIIGLKYPRGFTPDQMRAVDEQTRMPEDNSVRTIRVEPGLAGARFKEAVARSALNPRQFRNITGGATLKVETDVDFPERINGEYISSSAVVDGYPQARGGVLRLKPGASDAVIIHELGHHIDLHTRKVPILDTPSALNIEAGVGEGKADIITRDNYRPDPRRPRNMTEESNIYGVESAVALDHFSKILDSEPGPSGIEAIRRMSMRKSLEFAKGYTSTGAMPPNGHPYWKAYHDILTTDPERASRASSTFGLPIEDILGSIKSRM